MMPYLRHPIFSYVFIEPIIVYKNMSRDWCQQLFQASQTLIYGHLRIQLRNWPCMYWISWWFPPCFPIVSIITIRKFSQCLDKCHQMTQFIFCISIDYLLYFRCHNIRVFLQFKYTNCCEEGGLIDMQIMHGVNSLSKILNLMTVK